MVELVALSLSTVKTNLLELIKQSWNLEDTLTEIISSIRDKKVDVAGYTYLHEQLRKKGRLVVVPDEQLRKDILQLWHNSVVGDILE